MMGCQVELIVELKIAEAGSKAPEIAQAFPLPGEKEDHEKYSAEDGAEYFS
jgi:hypothetical protein